jgi:hypothetical protein
VLGGPGFVFHKWGPPGAGAPWGLPLADPKGAGLLNADPLSWDVPQEHPG